MMRPEAHYDIAAAKKLARKQAAEVRAAAHQRAGATAPAALARHGIGFVQPAPGAAVSGFLAYRTEIDIMPLMASLDSLGYRTSLPVVTGNREPLEFRLWAPGEPLVAGRWDIQTPPETAAAVEPDVLLVPLLAFDRHGFRLGYGGGFYDRSLTRLRAVKPVVAIGIAYAAQQVDAVPREPFDQPLDWILTEAGPLRPEPVA